MRLARAVFLRFSLHGAMTAASAALFCIAGCGGGSGPSGGPVKGESTTVAIQLSSRANDLLVQYTTTIQSIALTSQSGGTVTIFSTPANVDFIPANGEAYPVATVSVPQDVYTAAKITMAVPQFRYTFLDSSGGDNTANSGYFGATPVPVVTLAEPVTISGAAMGLDLSLDVSKSLTIANYKTPASATVTGNPTFALTAFPLSAEATTPLNGKCNDLNGQIASVNAAAGTMTVTLARDGAFASANGGTGAGYATGAQIVASLSASTVYEGVSGASALATGMFVNVDLALEPDGSYAATRVEVDDTTATDMTLAVAEFTSVQYSVLSTMPYQYQGSQLQASAAGDTIGFVYAGPTKFQASMALENFTGLPFTPAVNATSLAEGQRLSVGALSYPTTGGTYAQPTSVTLRQQTIDAVVTGGSKSGGYTVYTVQLAPYDPIWSLNGPPVNPKANPVPDPGVVTVYTNASTALVNTPAISTGGTYRFHGLLLDDGGVLRMVADQVSDGVAQ